MTARDQLFQEIWLEIDTTKRGFIYGKDLPLLVKKLVTNSKIVVDEDNLKLLDAFANEQAFTKIYKVVIDDTLKKLIGLTSVDLIGKENKSYTNVIKNNKSWTKIPQDKDEISILRQEIKEKDQIIINKDNELVSLQENITLYKEKYDHLVDEFEYFKKTINSNTKIINEPMNNDCNNNNDKSFDVRNQFFIEEFRRQINEQSKIINKLKEQIQTNPEIINHEKNKQSDRNTILGGKIPIFISKKFTWYLLIVSIFGLISSIYLKFIISDEPVITNIDNSIDVSSSWFHNNPMMIGIQWLVQSNEDNPNDSNELDSTEELDNQDMDAYNRIFAKSGKTF